MQRSMVIRRKGKKSRPPPFLCQGGQKAAATKPDGRALVLENVAAASVSYPETRVALSHSRKESALRNVLESVRPRAFVQYTVALLSRCPGTCVEARPLTDPQLFFSTTR